MSATLTARQDRALRPLRGQDGLLVDLIAERAVRLMPALELIQVQMDLTAVHRVVMPLRLRDLLVAREVDLLHDVLGIQRHLDRDRVVLTRCFVPRCAAPEHRA